MTQSADPANWRATEAQLESFVNETSLVPVVVLDAVTDELCTYFQHAPQVEALSVKLRADTTVSYIAGRSALCFANNEQFRQSMLQADPRPLYYAFVRHWVSGVLQDRFPEIYAKLPASFRMGSALAEGQAAA